MGRSALRASEPPDGMLVGKVNMDQHERALGVRSGRVFECVMRNGGWWELADQAPGLMIGAWLAFCGSRCTKNTARTIVNEIESTEMSRNLGI